MTSPTATTTTASPNPLEQLKDIHLPLPLDQIQLAPGWWIVIALTIGLIIIALNRWNKKRQALKLLTPANHELNKIAQLTPDSFAMAELSALLKRVCLVYYPKEQVAALTGDRWTNFINLQVGHELFTPAQQTLFSQLTYKAHAQIEAEFWQQIVNNSRIAIDCIIKQSASKQLNKKGRT